MERVSTLEPRASRGSRPRHVRGRSLENPKPALFHSRRSNASASPTESNRRILILFFSRSIKTSNTLPASCGLPNLSLLQTFAPKAPSSSSIRIRAVIGSMASPFTPQKGPHPAGAATGVAVEYIPAADPNPNPAPNPYVHYSGVSSPANGGNPYVQVSPVPGSREKNSMDTVLKLLGRCGKKLEEGTRKATETTGNVWHHLKTSPSVCDAAMARLAQGTKVLAEGGCDKIFQQTFGILPGEQLRKSFACYISTSSGPVIGTLYVSTRRLAFCSDNPLTHYTAQGQPEWVYYKVVVQLDQLRAVNPSANIRNPAEKYIQIVTADGHDFWFMGFVSYDKALKTLTEASHHFHL